MRNLFLILFAALFMISVSAQEPETTVVAEPVPAAPVVAAGSVDSNRFERIAALMEAGLQYANEGDYQEAEQAYLRALEKDPGNVNIKFQLSTLYIQTGKYKEAVQALQELLKSVPDSAMLLNNLAWIYAAGDEMKNGELALRYAREALLVSPINPNVWNTLAEAYYILGQYEPALRASGYGFDLLRMQQGVTEEQAQGFVQQYQKIQRAMNSSEMLLNPNPDE